MEEFIDKILNIVLSSDGYYAFLLIFLFGFFYFMFMFSQFLSIAKEYLEKILDRLDQLIQSNIRNEAYFKTNEKDHEEMKKDIQEIKTNVNAIYKIIDRGQQF